MNFAHRSEPVSKWARSLQRNDLSGVRRHLLAVALFAGTPALAAPTRLAPDHAPSNVLAWQGELRVGGEGGILQLGFIQTPAGDCQR